MKYRSRILLAGMAGNFIETFDMALCGLMSVFLAKYLIGNALVGLPLIFGTFFAGYLARPIGAVVLGLFSDVYGRKIVLSASILTMGIATALIGFIPENQAFGVSSIVLLLALRIIQSFSCGSEYLNSSAYLIENSDKPNKGFSGSWASFGAMFGALAASLTVWYVAFSCEKFHHLEWLIWRIPFVLALLGACIGLYVRVCIPESLEYIIYYAENPRPKLKKVFKEAVRHIIHNYAKSSYVFMLSCVGVATTMQIYIYAPTQAQLSGLFSHHQIMIANVTSLVMMLLLFPLFGKLSDHVDRSKIVIGAIVGFLIFLQPFFYFLSYGNYKALIGIHILIAIPAAAYYATVPVMLAEMYPLELRCTVLSMLYSTAASLAAGLAPYASYILLSKTQNKTSPAWVIFALIFLLLLTMKRYYAKAESTYSQRQSPIQS